MPQAATRTPLMRDDEDIAERIEREDTAEFAAKWRSTLAAARSKTNRILCSRIEDQQRIRLGLRKADSL
jgi:hypothetical protein